MTIRLYRYANFQYQSWFKFHVFDRKGAKEHQKGFRTWLAWSFRRLADRIDTAKSVLKVALIVNQLDDDTERGLEALYDAGMLRKAGDQ